MNSKPDISGGPDLDTVYNGTGIYPGIPGESDLSSLLHIEEDLLKSIPDILGEPDLNSTFTNGNEKSGDSHSDISTLISLDTAELISLSDKNDKPSHDTELISLSDKNDKPLSDKNGKPWLRRKLSPSFSSPNLDGKFNDNKWNQDNGPKMNDDNGTSADSVADEFCDQDCAVTQQNNKRRVGTVILPKLNLLGRDEKDSNESLVLERDLNQSNSNITNPTVVIDTPNTLKPNTPKLSKRFVTTPVEDSSQPYFDNVLKPIVVVFRKPPLQRTVSSPIETAQSDPKRRNFSTAVSPSVDSNVKGFNGG